MLKLGAFLLGKLRLNKVDFKSQPKKVNREKNEK